MFDVSHKSRFEAISAVVDLEGFSPFCTQPDNHYKLGSLLNFFFELVEDSLSTWALPERQHTKFLGDGALLIWRITDENRAEIGQKVVLGLHNLFRMYPELVFERADTEAYRAHPQRVRVGIAQGEIAELRAHDGSNEYVGFSINLAARLQKFCPKIGFLISTTVALPDQIIEDYSLITAKTKKPIKGMPALDEEVRYVAEDAHGISPVVKKYFVV